MAGDANALGVLAAESGIAVYLFEAIDHSRLRQATRGEPSADKGKASHHKQDYDADNRQPDQGAFFDQRRKPMVSPSLDLASCPPCFTDRNARPSANAAACRSDPLSSLWHRHARAKRASRGAFRALDPGCALSRA